MFIFLLKGIAAGFFVAAPVGPVSVLCMRHTLLGGWRRGLIAGTAIACADALYGVLAAVGAGELVLAASWLVILLKILGALYLFYLGFGAMSKKGANNESVITTNDDRVKVFRSMLGLTLASPVTVICFLSVFTSLGLRDSFALSPAGTIALGVFIGSFGWWMILVSALSRARDWFVSRLRVTNLASGLVLILFALIALRDGVLLLLNTQ